MWTRGLHRLGRAVGLPVRDAQAVLRGAAPTSRCSCPSSLSFLSCSSGVFHVLVFVYKSDGFVNYRDCAIVPALRDSIL